MSNEIVVKEDWKGEAIKIHKETVGKSFCEEGYRGDIIYSEDLNVFILFSNFDLKNDTKSTK